MLPIQDSVNEFLRKLVGLSQSRNSVMISDSQNGNRHTRAVTRLGAVHAWERTELKHELKVMILVQ